VKVAVEVAAAVEQREPVVALESTVFSTLGLPGPHNRKAIETAHNIIRNAGAVPALTAIIRGEATVGVRREDWDLVLTADRKVAARDLAVAVGQQWPVGVTTVSATMTLAHAAGIRVFATGGIGGVHADPGTGEDVSADLHALSSIPVLTVCAGAKSFLDLARTLERLETLSVPVLGWKTSELPAFTAATSGLSVPHRVDSAEEVARIAAAQFGLSPHAFPRPAGPHPGLLVAVPPPEPIDDDVLARATTQAEAAAVACGISGPALTPFILGEIAERTQGASVAANVALVAHNAAIASSIAVALGDTHRP